MNQEKKLLSLTRSSSYLKVLSIIINTTDLKVRWGLLIP